MEDAKKKLLVLSGAAQLIEVVQGAKEAGYYVIVTDYLDDSPAKKIADESWNLSITDVDGIVAKCKEEHVDGVMNYCIDPGQKPYQQICEKLGLPCVAGKEQFDIMTNKDVFKEVCKEYGLGYVKGYTLTEFPNSEILNSLNYPVIVKPVDGRASKGLTKCFNQKDLEKGVPYALDNSFRKVYEIEPFFEQKKEVQVKYFAADGEFFLTSMGDWCDSLMPDGTRLYVGSITYPSVFFEEYMETTNDKVIHMLKGVGIKNGAVALTAFYENGTFYFFDPALRMGGAQDWRIIAPICGVDLSNLLTNFAMTGSCGDVEEIRKVDCAFKNKSSALCYIDVRPGKIKQISGIDEVMKLKHVYGYHQSQFEGNEVKGFGTTANVALRFILVCDNWRELRELILKIQSLVKIVDENDENMIEGLFDVNQLPIN